MLYFAHLFSNIKERDHKHYAEMCMIIRKDDNSVISLDKFDTLQHQILSFQRSHNPSMNSRHHRLTGHKGNFYFDLEHLQDNFSVILEHTKSVPRLIACSSGFELQVVMIDKRLLKKEIKKYGSNNFEDDLEYFGDVIRDINREHYIRDREYPTTSFLDRHTIHPQFLESLLATHKHVSVDLSKIIKSTSDLLQMQQYLIKRHSRSMRSVRPFGTNHVAYDIPKMFNEQNKIAYVQDHRFDEISQAAVNVGVNIKIFDSLSPRETIVVFDNLQDMHLVELTSKIKFVIIPLDELRDLWTVQPQKRLKAENDTYKNNSAMAQAAS